MAVAGARPLARRAVCEDDGVAQLDARAAAAAKGRAARDDAAADARAERQHHDVGRAARRPGLPLADRGGVRVVVEPDRNAEPLLHAVAQRDMGKRDLRGDVDPAAGLVDRARYPEADRGHAVVCAERLDRRVDLRQQPVLQSVGVGRSWRRTISPSRATPARIFVPPRSSPIACVPAMCRRYRNLAEEGEIVSRDPLGTMEVD